MPALLLLVVDVVVRIGRRLHKRRNYRRVLLQHAPQVGVFRLQIFVLLLQLLLAWSSISQSISLVLAISCCSASPIYFPVKPKCQGRNARMLRNINGTFEKTF